VYIRFVAVLSVCILTYSTCMTLRRLMQMNEKFMSSEIRKKCLWTILKCYDVRILIRIDYPNRNKKRESVLY